VRVHPVRDLAALSGALAPLAPQLSGVSLSGFGAGEEPVRRLVGALGAARTAPFGALQAPPLAWRRDGLGVLSALLGTCP
jgi:hypothetical protein